MCAYNFLRSRLNSTGSSGSNDEFFEDEYTPSEFESSTASSSTSNSPSYTQFTNQHHYQQQQPQFHHAIAMNRMNLEMNGPMPFIDHFHHTMDAREYLPEFTGQIPMRHKKMMAPKPEPATSSSPSDMNRLAAATAAMAISDDDDRVQPDKQGAVAATAATVVCAAKPKTNVSNSRIDNIYMDQYVRSFNGRAHLIHISIKHFIRAMR